MALIHVPRPPKSAYNPNRKASALLRTQVDICTLSWLETDQRGLVFVSANSANPCAFQKCRL